MMNKRFIYGKTILINTDEFLSCITDKKTNKDYVKFIDVIDLLNEQEEIIQRLLKISYDLTGICIWEFSSTIAQDEIELDKVFESDNIQKILQYLEKSYD